MCKARRSAARTPPPVRPPCRRRCPLRSQPQQQPQLSHCAPPHASIWLQSNAGRHLRSQHSQLPDLRWVQLLPPRGPCGAYRTEEAATTRPSYHTPTPGGKEQLLPAQRRLQAAALLTAPAAVGPLSATPDRCGMMLSSLTPAPSMSCLRPLHAAKNAAGKFVCTVCKAYAPRVTTPYDDGAGNLINEPYCNGVCMHYKRFGKVLESVRTGLGGLRMAHLTGVVRAQELCQCGRRVLCLRLAATPTVCRPPPLALRNRTAPRRASTARRPAAALCASRSRSRRQTRTP